MIIDAKNMLYAELNKMIRDSDEQKFTLENVLGQRYIGAGLSGKEILIKGTPGNALGAYLDGACIEVRGNAQDAVGDTMNGGRIIVHGSIGDAAGYAMRGGEIYVQGDAGYRAGIHMKAYGDKVPALVIGGTAGSFLGEYQAGGIILVLGLSQTGRPIVSNFPCTGMHGGKLYLRSDGSGLRLPGQVKARPAGADDLTEISNYVQNYCAFFGGDRDAIMGAPFTVITPDTKNPYRQMYVLN